MSKKTNAQLLEEIDQLKVDLDAASGELAAIKDDYIKKMADEKAKLLNAMVAEDKARQDELAVATAGFEALFEKAREVKATLEGQDTQFLGIPATAARDAQLSMLEEIFGEL